ncbi:MAG: YidC/Oxa1 family membrane protein insertase [Chloroflexi bacterium]|nr:YidC/Oxa1 family membrane protein insertase [Chloroflexota bacterium]
MGGFLELWNTGVVTPLADALILLTNFLGNYGLAIILFTVVVKLVMLPLTIQQVRSSRAMMVVQPKLKELQKKYGKDREKLMQEQMRLYKEHKVNPAAGCLPLLIQMPVWFGLYQALILLSHRPEFAQSGFLWISSLAQREGPPYILAILTGATQWVVQRMMAPRTDDPQQKMMNQMTQFMPLMFLVFAFQVPAGLVLYWVTSNLFTFAQQYFITGWGSLVPERGWGSLADSIMDLLGGKKSDKLVARAATKGPRARVPAVETSSNGSRAAALSGANGGIENNEQQLSAEEEAIQQARAATYASGSKKKKKGRRR